MLVDKRLTVLMDTLFPRHVDIPGVEYASVNFWRENNKSTLDSREPLLISQPLNKSVKSYLVFVGRLGASPAPERHLLQVSGFRV